MSGMLKGHININMTFIDINMKGHIIILLFKTQASTDTKIYLIYIYQNIS